MDRSLYSRSPHGGVASVPGCQSEDISCQIMHSIVQKGVYLSWVQNKVIQAQYFKQWDHYGDYLAGNIFLPLINNEKESRPDYQYRLAALQRLVLVMFENDEMVIPKESAWFSFYNATGQVVGVREHPQVYQLLRILDLTGRIDFVSLPGGHMHVPIDTLRSLVVKYFGNTVNFNRQ